jgi:hypothetical protein
MREEIMQSIIAINERDEKCKLDMERILNKVDLSDQLKASIIDITAKGQEVSLNDKKEIQKIEAFKEHRLALLRHL